VDLDVFTLTGLPVEFPQLVHTIAVITPVRCAAMMTGINFSAGEREAPRAARQFGSLEVDDAQRNCSI
jgi:hypothetical protein